MQAGRLDQRVVIERKATSRAANGEEVVTWAVLDTVSASVVQLRGKEFFAAAQVQGSVDHQVRMRYRSDITRDMRLVWHGQPLDIVSIAELGRRDGLELLCIAGVRNG